MSTRTNLAAAAASLSVLAIGWQVGAHAAAPVATETTAVTTATVATTSAPAPAMTQAPEASTAAQTTSTDATTEQATTQATTQAASGLKDGTYTGQDVSYRYGTIAVTVTVKGGAITGATASSMSDSGHSERIASQAVPMLNDEVVQVQSAQIGTVGGATFTSEAYATSLQSALDQAA